MKFSKFKGIIFDLDGTLINSSHVWSDIDIKFLAKRGLKVPENYFKAVSTMNFSEAAEYTNTLFNLNESLEDIASEWYEMAYYEYAHNIFLKDGAEDFLNGLKENGVKIALATAVKPPALAPVIPSIISSNTAHSHGLCFIPLHAYSYTSGKPFPLATSFVDAKKSNS